MAERNGFREGESAAGAGSPRRPRRPARSRPDALLDVVRELVDELALPGRVSATEATGATGPTRPAGPSWLRSRRLRLDSSLGAELGLDSLARAELVGRLERRFAVVLPDRVLVEAESPRDLLRALEAAPAPSVPLRRGLEAPDGVRPPPPPSRRGPRRSTRARRRP